MNTRQPRSLHELAQQARRDRRLLLEVLGSDSGEAVLQRLEERFEVDLPVFQGKAGQYDALDAMRRDAQREVFLVIRRQLDLARQEATENNNEYEHDPHTD